MNNVLNEVVVAQRKGRRSLTRGVLALLGATAAMVFVISLPASLEIASKVLTALTHSF